MFTLWHYLIRILGPLLFLLAACGFVFQPEYPLIIWAGQAAGALLALLGLCGAGLAVALFCGFKFRCPHCDTKNTDLGMHEKRLWLNCPYCGLTEETGFLKLHLTLTPKHEMSGAEAGPNPDHSEVL